MDPEPEKKPTETTPAVLARAIDAAVERYFAGLDEKEEAARLGIDEEVIRGLHRRLLELRDVADLAERTESGGTPS